MTKVAFDPAAISYVASIDDVRARHPAAMSRATGKVLSRLDKHCRAMIARATFVVIGTHGSNGADVSPRGDPAGFVRVLDDRHLLLPDRIGNNRFDSMDNIFETGRIGMLFLVPGMAEVLRINGTRAHHRRCGAAGGLRRAGSRPEDRRAGRGPGGLSALRQGDQPRRPLGPFEAYRPQRVAELRRDAGRPLRRDSPRRRATGRAPRWPGAGCIDPVRGVHHKIPSFEIT